MIQPSGRNNDTPNPDNSPQGVYDDKFNKMLENGQLGKDPESNQKYVSSEQLNESEASGASFAPAPPPKEETAETLNTAPKNPNTPFSYNSGSKNSVKKSKGKKRLLIIAAPGLLLVLGLIIMLLIASSLKIQNFATHLAEYDFLRVNREFASSVDEQMAERFTIDSANSSFLDSLQASFGDLRSNTWGQLDKFRPQKIIDNLRQSNALKFNYTEVDRTGPIGSVIGGKKLVLDSISIGDQDPIPAADLQFGRYFSNLGAKIDLQDKLTSAVEKALPDTPNIVRNKVVRALQEEIGVRLTWWENLGAKFKGKSEDQAFTEQQQEAAKTISENATPESVNPEINTAATDVANTEQQAIQDGTAKELNLAAAQALQSSEATGNKTLIQQATDQFSTIRAAVGNTLKDTPIETAAKIVDPIAKIAFPVCLIYDGAIVPGKPKPKTIDAQSTELQRTFYGVESASDQQKAGDTAPEAVGALNNKLGDTSRSIVEVRATGSPVNTTDYVGGGALPQASGTGSFTLPQALLGNNVIQYFLDHVLGTACPVILSPAGIVTGALASIIGVVIPFGGEAELTAAATADGAAQVVSNEAIPTLSEKIGSFAFQLGRDTLALGSLTILAKLLVLHYSNTQNNGLAVGNDFMTQADMGGNLQGNEINRKLMAGRPMTTPEIALTTAADYAYLNKQQASQTPFQRYLALSNADSLINKFGIGLLANFGHWNSITNKLIPNLLADFVNIFNGRSFAVIFKPAQAHALAVTSQYVQTANYGIVQWGFTPDEDTAIKTNPAYDSLYNAEWVAHHIDVINQVKTEFGICYSETMGQLLTDGSIYRDEQGNVDPNNGKCAPNKLSMNNPEYCKFGACDAVFRWRLSIRNENVLNHMVAVQDPGLTQ